MILAGRPLVSVVVSVSIVFGNTSVLGEVTRCLGLLSSISSQVSELRGVRRGSTERSFRGTSEAGSFTLRERCVLQTVSGCGSTLKVRRSSRTLFKVFVKLTDYRSVLKSAGGEGTTVSGTLGYCSGVHSGSLRRPLSLVKVRTSSSRSLGGVVRIV